MTRPLPDDSHRQRPATHERGLSVRLVTAALAVTLLSGTISEDAARHAERRRQIESLTQSEINHLKRNYERFEKMSPEARQALFRLHEQVAADRTGHLKNLLTDYNEWFSSLSPFDREDLLNKTDPVERAILVQKLREEQKQQRLARARSEDYPFLAARVTPAAEAHAVLGPQQMDAVSSAIAEKVLKTETREKIDASLSGRSRHLHVLKLAMEQLKQERLNDKPAAASHFKQLVSSVVDVLPDDRRPANQMGTLREIRQIGLLLGRSLVAEWAPEIEADPPTQEQIDAMVQKWQAAMPSDEKKQQQQQRLKTPEGRRFAEIQVALQTNPKLAEIRPVAYWLIRGFGQDGRGGGAPRREAAPGGANRRPGARKAANSARSASELK